MTWSLMPQWLSLIRKYMYHLLVLSLNHQSHRRLSSHLIHRTPTGRIINRFSKDLYTVDEQVVAAGRSYLANIVNVFSTVIVVMAVTPMFIIGLVPVGSFSSLFIFHVEMVVLTLSS